MVCTGSRVTPGPFRSTMNSEIPRSSAPADVRAASLETLVHLTAAKYGVTLVPRLAVANWPGLSERLAARPIRGANASRRVRLVYRRDMPRRRAIEALADVVRANLPDCVTRLQ